MNLYKKEKSYYHFLKKILESIEEEKLLTVLNEQARMIDIDAHDDFENALLDLARETSNKTKRKTLVEILASLESIWDEHMAKKDLSKKFWVAFEKNDNQKSGELYSDLSSQGLDYIGNVPLEGPGECKILPIETAENSEILHYTDDNLHFLDLDLQLKKTIITPGRQKAIDVLPPLKGARIDEGDVNTKLWILLEDGKQNRSVVSMDIADKRINKNSIAVTGEVSTANRLSRFQNHLLLVSETKIFIHKGEVNWEDWFQEKQSMKMDAENKAIVCTEPAKGNYWVGLSDKNVRILKSLEKRKKFAPLPSGIKSIESSEKFVVVTGEDRIVLSDIEGRFQWEQSVEGTTIKSIILNNETILTLTTNGLLSGRNIHKGNIRLKINLKERYDSLFTCGNRVYCTTNRGKVTVLEVPDMHRFQRALISKGIHLMEEYYEKDPKAPVRHFSEFVGRAAILEQIKEDFHSHFLIAGGPKVGKTSLLNILPEILENNSECCYIDMETILKESDSYESFERNFFIKCLVQHGLRLEDLTLNTNTNFEHFRETMHKVRALKRFCVFCIDNFRFPFTGDRDKNFMVFLKNMFRQDNSRMILTCRREDIEDIKSHFNEIENTIRGRKIKKIYLSLFTAEEAKKAVRKMTQLKQKPMEKIYQYIGGFPHLLPLFENCPDDVDKYASGIANDNPETIFDYFRELSPDAYLLISILFHEELISKKVPFSDLYRKYPLLNQLIPKKSLISIIKKIPLSYDCFEVEIPPDENHFSMNLKYPARLFHNASKNLPELEVFIAMNKFKIDSTPQTAEEFIFAYRNALNIKGPPYEYLARQDRDSYFKDIKNQYKSEFYIWQLSEESRKALLMPLATFVVIPLQAWLKEESIKNFSSLYNSIHGYLQRSGIQMKKGTASRRFYILFFEFHGFEVKEIREEMKGLERISIINTHTMKNILLSEEKVKPLPKSSEEIFKQLKISERSPYIDAGPVQELFFGRHLEIALIRGLHENIGVFGTRTIGKTSLLLKFYRSIENVGNWKVYALDCAGIEDEKSLLQKLAVRMGVDFNLISNLEKFQHYVTKKAEDEKSQYLFLLDEVDSLVAYDMDNEQRIFNVFNKMCTEPLKSRTSKDSSESRSAARFILFGFQQMHDQMNNPKSRLYNFMVFLPLKSLDKESALNLVTKPMKNIHVKWENEEDAHYLVDQCSGYPVLLQTACQALLTILDDKNTKSDILERGDVDKVFYQQKFIQLCMRFYDPMIKDSLKSKGLFGNRKKSITWEKEPFFEDIHKITIWIAFMLHYEEKKMSFTLTEIQEELKRNQIDLFPGLMRKVLDRLYLNGTFDLIGEPKIIAPDAFKIKKEVDVNVRDSVYTPLFYKESEENRLKLKYQFGVKIFPKILEAKYDGIENCKKELESLIRKKQWKQWLKNHS